MCDGIPPQGSLPLPATDPYEPGLGITAPDQLGGVLQCMSQTIRSDSCTIFLPFSLAGIWRCSTKPCLPDPWFFTSAITKYMSFHNVFHPEVSRLVCGRCHSKSNHGSLGLMILLHVLVSFPDAWFQDALGMCIVLLATYLFLLESQVHWELLDAKSNTVQGIISLPCLSSISFNPRSYKPSFWHWETVGSCDGKKRGSTSGSTCCASDISDWRAGKCPTWDLRHLSMSQQSFSLDLVICKISYILLVLDIYA